VVGAGEVVEVWGAKELGRGEVEGDGSDEGAGGEMDGLRRV